MSPTSRHFTPNAQQFSDKPIQQDPIFGGLSLSGEDVWNAGLDPEVSCIWVS